MPCIAFINGVSNFVKRAYILSFKGVREHIYWCIWVVWLKRNQISCQNILGSIVHASVHLKGRNNWVHVTICNPRKLDCNSVPSYMLCNSCESMYSPLIPEILISSQIVWSQRHNIAIWGIFKWLMFLSYSHHNVVSHLLTNSNIDKQKWPIDLFTLFCSLHRFKPNILPTNGNVCRNVVVSRA